MPGVSAAIHQGGAASMSSFMQRSARHFLILKAAKELKKDIEQAGLDNLTALADAGRSIVGTYLDGCSPQEKARIRRDFNVLQQFGVTPEMVLSEIARQMPEVGPIMESRKGYKESEIEEVTAFLNES